MSAHDDDDVWARVAQRVCPGATLLRRGALQGGVSARVEALTLALPSGAERDVVVRMHAAGWKNHPDDIAATEHALHATLRSAGLPVPEPLALDMSCELLPSPWLALERVEGSTDVDDASLPGALAQMAAFLARLHALPVALAPAALPPGDDPIAGALRFLPDDDATRPLRDALAQHGSGRATEAERRALLHGDFWPGNLLWRDGRLAAVLDWEDAAVGDPWSDVACCRVELACKHGDDAVAHFTRAYTDAASQHGARSEARSALAVWDLYVAAAALATMHHWGLPADVEAARRARTTAFLARARRDLLDG